MPFSLFNRTPAVCAGLLQSALRLRTGYRFPNETISGMWLLHLLSKSSIIINISRFAAPYSGARRKAPVLPIVEWSLIYRNSVISNSIRISVNVS
jgi:hypothetical protein